MKTRPPRFCVYQRRDHYNDRDVVEFSTFVFLFAAESKGWLNVLIERYIETPDAEYGPEYAAYQASFLRVIDNAPRCAGCTKPLPTIGRGIDYFGYDLDCRECFEAREQIRKLTDDELPF